MTSHYVTYTLVSKSYKIGSTFIKGASEPSVKKLTARTVAGLRESGRYSDGGRGSFGLYLLVRQRRDGGISRSWCQRIRIDGRPTNVGLGSYPIVTLAEARVSALENQRTVRRGGDPRRARKPDTAELTVPTFAEAAEEVIALHAAGWRDGGRSEKKWSASLATYAYSAMGSKAVDKITSADVLAVLTPIWAEKASTAKRVRQRISAVMRWAVAQGYRTDDPAGSAIIKALPKYGRRTTHFRALPHAEVAGAVSKIRTSDGASASARLALEFLILTSARSGEVRGATWSEIDLGAATWTVAAGRAKTGRPHRVPLSTGALSVLERARGLGFDDDTLIFPGGRSGRPLSDATLSLLCKTIGIDATPHGFRSSFRSWAADTGAPRELAEAALAHVVKGVEGAYQRSDLFDRRREIMAGWADYVTPTNDAH